MTRNHSGSDNLKTLAADVLRLSRLLTKERDELPSRYLNDPALRSAYLSYYLPPNADKIHAPLRELISHPARPLALPALSVLDLGCGPGTAMLGVMKFFADRRPAPDLRFTAIDHVAENLKDAERLLRQAALCYPGKMSFDGMRGDAASAVWLPHKRYDLIILSNVLNELKTPAGSVILLRAEHLRSLCAGHLTDVGSCIIIEPALRETSRELLAVRDLLIEGGLRVFSPCLTQQPCPALGRDRDWCHEDRPWAAPELILRVDAATGLRKDALKFSYLVLRKDELSLADIAPGPLFRVVSEPLRTKGKLEFYLCGGQGRRLTTRLDKDKSAANGAFDILARGDVVAFQGLSAGEDRDRVGKDTIVVRSFSAR